MGTRSLGRILKPLPLYCSFSERFGKREQPVTNVGRASHAYGRLGQSTGQHAQSQGMAQFLGREVDVREIISCAAELCASKPGTAWPGTAGESLQVVLGRMVRK